MLTTMLQDTPSTRALKVSSGAWTCAGVGRGPQGHGDTPQLLYNSRTRGRGCEAETRRCGHQLVVCTVDMAGEVRELDSFAWSPTNYQVLIQAAR